MAAATPRLAVRNGIVGEAGFGLLHRFDGGAEPLGEHHRALAIGPAEDDAELAGPAVSRNDVARTMNERLQRAGDAFRGCVGFGFSLRSLYARK